MGTRCFSHDSIFMPAEQGEEEHSIQAISQEYLVGNVKALRLSGNIRFGVNPDSISRKRMQGLGTSTGEMNSSHISPMEIGDEQDKEVQQKSATVLTGSPGSFSSMTIIELEHKAEEKATPIKPSRSKRPLASTGTIESINLDAVPRSVDRLDNTFAKHKLSVKPKNQRVSKKHRGMSEEYPSIEDTAFENESAPIRNSLDKTMYNSTEISSQNLHKSDQSQWKKTEVQSYEKVHTLIKSEDGKDIKKLGKENVEEKKLEKYQELISPKHRAENRFLDKVEKDLELEKQRQEEEEERKRQLKRELEIKEQQRLEEERRRRAEQILQELEEHRRQEELKLREREEQKAIQKAEEQRQEEERRRREEQIKIEEQKRQELKLLEKQNQQKKKDTETKPEVCFLASDTKLKDKEAAEKEKMIVETSQDDEIQKNKQQTPTEDQVEGRNSEEQRWKELDQRQRPFTFKVSAGEKQILFQRVNLSPVTPSKEPTVSPDSHGSKENKPNITTHSLPSSLCVPHTAILVTGAQLCGTAVNLDQIKDSACKSLLGLTDEKKHLEDQTAKSEKGRQDPTTMTSRTKYTSESLDAQSVLNEWTSIRSKILSKSENISMLEKAQRNSQLQRDDWTGKGNGELHSNLRKTLSASAKFSITPAWQKFAESVTSQQLETMTTQTSTETVAATKPVLTNNATQDKSLEVNSSRETIPSKLRKQVTSNNSTEGFIFSKDLPSFLVPHPPHSPRRGQVEPQTGLDMQVSNGTQKNDKTVQNGEEKTSPFGIKLRRTNYSLRFHSDPLNDQKRKKRYSAGDSFDGVPASFNAADETEPSNTSRKELSASPTKIKKDNLASISMDTSSSLTDLHSVSPPLISSSSSYIPSPNKGRTVPKSLSVEKPCLAPKPSSPTSTPSLLSKLDRSNLVDLSAQKLEKSDPDKAMLGESMKGSVALPSSSPGKNEEPESKDKKCYFPSIHIPWREKSEKRPEQISKERPALQSRHSLDGTRLMEKPETEQPLWITLALQKQKGFREQHTYREDRKQARETKQSEKINKENASESVVTGEYRTRCGSLQKPVAQEEKKCETVVTRLQRREQLQKSNTLPTSVTVEITDGVQVPPLAKDIPKRFSTPDASPVSSEPAWLALAKRKSKAWSDCPQIIK
ncbi:capping protein inhibiting regulator of actin dynamics isoform X2 [Xenopus laevis]|uniref:Capping protein inhibiting regulator of actin dynamics isoform X2 n=1 Tax=Xenopus laevis TaxID=8355 RepID=A0A8J1MV82_XENLA|nr:capping protein inhibiting regulator of actin dynamics isoform X2 [Xenopus laevis]